MVSCLYPNSMRTLSSINTGLLESTGHCLVFTPNSLPIDGIFVRTPYCTFNPAKTVSIVICTYGRPESLNETLASLTEQTYKDFEVILLTEKGDLSQLRDSGLRCARGDIVSFIDDDVYCPPAWLESVVKGFRVGVVGVSGPTFIPDSFRGKRDLFKWPWLGIHDWLFLEGKALIPGYLSSSGTPSYASSRGTVFQEDCDCLYLEACNISVRKKEAIEVGGFDLSFTKTSEWCEVDLSLKLSQRGQLRFLGGASLTHKPSQEGIYKERLKTNHRWKNFLYFQKKWENKFIKPGLMTYAYRGWVWTYLTLKNIRMI